MNLAGFKKIYCIFLFSLFIFSSCSNKTENCIDLSKSFSYLNVGTEPGTIEQIQLHQNEFQKLEYWGHHNILNIEDKDGTYVWLKSDFEVPESLKGKDISFLVSYIHFAEKTYLNGIKIGESGCFPDKNGKCERSSMYATHCYDLNKSLLNEDGKNTLYIQIYSKGNAECSGYCLIGPSEQITELSIKNRFWSSRFYLLLFFSPIITCVLFLILFITSRNKNWNNYFFALECLFSAGIYAYFFAAEVPIYTNWGISHLWYTKVLLCVCVCLFVHFLSLFTINFIKGNIPKNSIKIQESLLIISILLIVAAPNLSFLMKWTLPICIVLLIKFGIAIYYAVCGLKNKKQHKNAVVLLLAFAPFYSVVIFDILYHLIVDYSMVSYYPIIGHQISTFVFIFILCKHMNKALDDNKYLNENLEREIQLQMVDITFANERLEQEIKRAEKDLEMASVVQKKFLFQDNSEIEGWDIAFVYEPLAKVSGDLYDYYCDGKKLLGFSLFDVSGHGVAASLVTMLSKNIIFKTFKRSLNTQKTVSETLMEINESIVNSKGDIENYLTGLLFHVFDEVDGVTHIQMASGGHPYPIFYSAESDDIELLLIDPSQEQIGAVGIKGIEVSYPNIDFEMKKGDILVACTDGLFESYNELHEQFGRERAEKIIKENKELSSEEIKEKLMLELNSFMDENPRDDDITMIVLKKL